MKKHFLTFGLFISFLSILSAQNSEFEHEYELLEKTGIIINGNVGISSGANYLFKKNESSSQNYLGPNLLAFDRGMDVFVLFKNGLFIKGNAYYSKSIKSDRAGDIFQVQGQWEGKGISFGLGYGGIDEEDFLFLPSINFGTMRSTWDFVNESTTSQHHFGSVDLIEDQNEQFYSDNYFVDFNVTYGGWKSFKIEQMGFVPSFSMGFSHSINKGAWFNAEDQSELEDIQDTRFIGIYFKFCLGIGALMN